MSNASYTNINNLSITNSYKSINSSDELDNSLKLIIDDIIKKSVTTSKNKTTWTKNESIEKRQSDIPNPNLKYSMIRIYELAKLYEEINSLKHTVIKLLDEKNKLINEINDQNELIINIKNDKKKIVNDFLQKQKKILRKLNKI
jgi:hypothetical protein